MDETKDAVEKMINDAFPQASNAPDIVQNVINKIFSEALSNPSAVNAGMTKLKSMLAGMKADGKEFGLGIGDELVSGLKDFLSSPITRQDIIDQVTNLFGSDKNLNGIKEKAKGAWIKYSTALKNASSVIGFDFDFLESAVSDPLQAIKTAFNTTDVSDITENLLGRAMFSAASENAKKADSALNRLMGDLSE